MEIRQLAADGATVASQQPRSVRRMVHRTAGLLTTGDDEMALSELLSIALLLPVCLGLGLSAASVAATESATSRLSGTTSTRPSSGRPPSARPLVIAHRGACGVLPEHTVPAYRRAIADGADVIECDVTLTHDQVPVCLHEEMLDATTDVADRAEFVDRRRSISVSVYGTRVSVRSTWRVAAPRVPNAQFTPTARKDKTVLSVSYQAV